MSASRGTTATLLPWWRKPISALRTRSTFTVTTESMKYGAQLKPGSIVRWYAPKRSTTPFSGS